VLGHEFLALLLTQNLSFACSSLSLCARCVGTVIHFDDGDVQDLDLTVIKWNSLQDSR
jgi:hypothetical protein